MGWEIVVKFKREGTYVYLRLIHIEVWEKPTQHCKVIIFRLKIGFFKVNKQSRNRIATLREFPGNPVVRTISSPRPVSHETRPPKSGRFNYNC